ncbi:RxLR effector protein, partial [Phytophthora megakarya]
MRHYFLVCLPLLVNVVLIDADSSSVGPKVLQSDCSKIVIHQITTQNEFTHTRLLRSNSASSTRNTEERTGGSVIEKLTSMFKSKGVTKLETEWLQTWLRHRKSPDKALIDLGFGKAADTLLESALFNTWAKYLDDFNEKYPDKKTTMIEAFTKTFGDAGVTTMLHAAKKSIKTDDIAKKLESDQLKMWLSSEKSVDDLFTALNLDKIGYDFKYDLRDNPLFKTWMSYANVFIKEHPEKKGTLFSAWKDHI